MRLDLDDYDDPEVLSTFYKQYAPQTSQKKIQSNSNKNTRSAQSQYLQSSFKFIKGPIDLEWLLKAMELGYPATRLALLLLFKRGIQKSKKVTVTKSEKDMFNLNRSTCSKALKEMERAGLVTVKKSSKGKKSEIVLNLKTT